MTEVLAELLVVDRRDERRLSRSLTAQLRNLIAADRLASGSRLPSSREFARALGVSRNTVTAVFGQLSAEGYLAIQPGRRPVIAAGIGASSAISRGGEGGASFQPAPASWAASLGEAPPTGRTRPLHAGFGDVREFPHAEWARCLRDAARRGADRSFAINAPALQAALRDHLQAQRGVRTAMERIVILPTAQAALTMMATIALDPGDVAWLEEPGYPGIRRAVAATGAVVVAVPVDRHGLVPPTDPSRPRLIFTTPSHQFPTGSLMSVGRRRSLLQIARRSGALIVEDDYDGEYHFDGVPAPALQALDEAGTVAYVGTLSKATTPAIRLGYIVAPESLLPTIHAVQRHWGLIAAPHVQEALSLFIQRGHYLAHVRRTGRIYQARRDHLVSQLRAHLAGVLAVAAPAGGLQLQASLLHRTDDAAIAAALARQGIDLTPLSGFYAGEPASAGFLLGFASWREEEIDRAVACLRDAITRGPARP